VNLNDAEAFAFLAVVSIVGYYLYKGVNAVGSGAQAVIGGVADLSAATATHIGAALSTSDNPVAQGYGNTITNSDILAWTDPGAYYAQSPVVTSSDAGTTTNWGITGSSW
jgi:hypothetical protein